MKFTAEQIAGVLEGEVVGNPNAEVSTLSKIEEGIEGSLTFLSNPKYVSFIYSTQASVTIVNRNFVPESPISTTLIKVEDLASTLQVCLDSGAKKVLLPITSAEDLGTVPSDLVGAFSLIFYSSPEEAVYKALGVE